MSLSSPPTSSTQTMGNTPPQKLSTNQQTLPLPYFFGTRWFALTWCVRQPHNITIIPAQGGGKSAKGGGGQKKYACDVAGLVACGPADNLAEIEVNGESVWAGGIARSAAHPEHTGDIVVDGVGTFRLHWGTESANGDWLVLGAIPEEHPFYRGQIVLECKQLVASAGGSLPNVRVLIERAPVVAGMDCERTREGANPITGLVEYIQNDFYGLGLSDAVDMPSAIALASALHDRTKIISLNGNPNYVARMSYISACIEDRRAFGTFLAAVLENFDGWARRNGRYLQFGRFPAGGFGKWKNENTDTPTVYIPALYGFAPVTIETKDLTEDPQLSSPGNDDESVITDAIVTGPDIDWGMQDTWAVGTSAVARDRLGQMRTKTFERKFIVTDYQRREQAQELALRFSSAAGQDSISVIREKAANVWPGDGIILDYAPAGLREVYRVTRRREPSTGGVIELGLERDRWYDQSVTLPVVSVTPASGRPVLPAPSAVTNVRLLQVSSAWSGTTAPALLPLVVRPSGAEVGYRVHYSSTGASYDEIASSQAWALGGTLVDAISDTAATLTTALSGPDIAILDEQSTVAQADDTLLLVVVDEVMSIGAVTALGGARYELAVLRGRRGSAAAAHAAGAAVHVIPRSSCELLTHADFPRTAETRYFKFQPSSPAGELELSECAAIAYQFDPTPESPQTLTFTLAEAGPLDGAGNPIPPPAGASGWMTDSAGRYVPFYGTAA